ncbi:MAG TPA: ABC transporter permease [candidate division Zixibacteria bacterium]|nr:ABC transporter permease [candidate division Zixibacteria bacterium]
MTAATTATGGTRHGALRELWSSALTIMVKELRSRFRGRRAFLVLTLYLAVLAALAYGMYTVTGPAARNAARLAAEFGDPTVINASARVGQGIFSILSVFQLLLIGFIAPAFTAGAISLEREKQTLDLLIATPIRPAGLVIGKLFSALAFVVLMIVAAIPISALVLMYGGATVDDILRQQAVLFSSAIGFGVIGLFWSALTRRTQTATVLTYSTLLALTIGTLLVWRFWTDVATAAPDNVLQERRTAPEAILYVNPAVAMIEIVANTELEYGDFSDAYNALRPTGAGGEECIGDACLPLPKGRPVPAEPPMPRGGVDLPAGPRALLEPAVDFAVPPDQLALETEFNHFWPRITLTYAVLSVVLTLVAMRLVQPAGTRLHRWRIRRRSSGPERAVPLEAGAGIEEISG